MQAKASFRGALENVFNICVYFCLLPQSFSNTPFPGQGSRAQMVREAV